MRSWWRAAPRDTDLAYDIGGRGGTSFNDAAYAGLERWVAGLGLVRENTRDVAAAQNESHDANAARLRQLAQEGFDPGDRRRVRLRRGRRHGRGRVALAGLGGAARTLNPGQLGYLEGQTGGRGYIGPAAMIFGNWRPGGLLAGSALFGYIDGVRLRAGGEAVRALLHGASILAVGLALMWVARQRWQPAVVAASAGVAVYLLYYTAETVPRGFASLRPAVGHGAGARGGVATTTVARGRRSRVPQGRG